MSQDPHAGRFLNSDDTERPQFRALGRPGSDSYAGLETFPNPGCNSVTYVSDEVIGFCPITQQKDMYVMELTLLRTEEIIESKSLKIWLEQFNHPSAGVFGEGLAVYIRDQVGEVLGYDSEETNDHIQVVLTQKSRGGISIRSVA